MVQILLIILITKKIKKELNHLLKNTMHLANHRYIQIIYNQHRQEDLQEVQVPGKICKIYKQYLIQQI